MKRGLYVLSIVDSFVIYSFLPRMPLHKSSSEDGSGGESRCIVMFLIIFFDPKGKIERWE